MKRNEFFWQTKIRMTKYLFSVLFFGFHFFQKNFCFFFFVEQNTNHRENQQMESQKQVNKIRSLLDAANTRNTQLQSTLQSQTKQISTFQQQTGDATTTTTTTTTTEEAALTTQQLNLEISSLKEQIEDEREHSVNFQEIAQRAEIEIKEMRLLLDRKSEEAEKEREELTEKLKLLENERDRLIVARDESESTAEAADEKLVRVQV